MYVALLDSLTSADRKELAERGVPSSRISEWKTGFRFPTRPQTLALAEVKRVDYMELERELMLLETQEEAKKKPSMRDLLARVMGLQKINDVISE